MVKRAELQCFETKRHNLKCIIKGVNSNEFDYSRDNFHTILPNWWGIHSIGGTVLIVLNEARMKENMEHDYRINTN